MRSPSPKTNNPAATIVSVSDLEVRFNEQTVLSRVSFDINRGEIVAIIGPNGSGKTTLLRAILGLTPLYKGEVSIDGKPPNRVRGSVGYLPQKFQFDPSFPITVKEYLNITVAKGSTFKWQKKLHEVGLAENILNKRLGSLSGGQLQRVLIAQATLHNPPLLILDEPSTGIDLTGEQQFYDLIRAQRDTHGTTVILVSHDISVVANVVDKIVCVNKRLVCFGPPRQALTEETISELYGHQNGSLYSHHHH